MADFVLKKDIVFLVTSYFYFQEVEKGLIIMVKWKFIKRVNDTAEELRFVEYDLIFIFWNMFKSNLRWKLLGVLTHRG